MRVSVKLTGGLDKITFIAGCERIEPSEYSERKERWGISIFYNDNYLLNFVLNEDEVELLQSNSKIKAVDDLGFRFFADKSTLKVNKHYGEYTKEVSEFIKQVPEKKGVTYNIMQVVSTLVFISETKGDFAKGICTAMHNPETSSNIFTQYPEGSDEFLL